MSPRLLFRALRRPLIKPDPCIFCQAQQFTCPVQNARYSRATDINPNISEGKQKRLEIDRQSRAQVYSSAKARGHIRLSPGDVEALISQFTKGASVQELAKSVFLRFLSHTSMAHNFNIHIQNSKSTSPKLPNSPSPSSAPRDPKPPKPPPSQNPTTQT